jgi:hypothetical protein
MFTENFGREKAMSEVPWDTTHGHMHPAAISVFERFVVRNGEDECWGWRGWYNPSAGHRRSAHMYGRMRLQYQKKRITYPAHRFSYLMYNYPNEPSPLERKDFICHTCDNPICCNPKHLYVGNHEVNMADMVHKGRSTAGMHGNGARYSKKVPIAVHMLRSKGLEYLEISDEVNDMLGVRLAKSTISGILNGKTWRNVYVEIHGGETDESL